MIDLEIRMMQYLSVQGCAFSTIKAYRDILRVIRKGHPDFENYEDWQLIGLMSEVSDPITRSGYRNVILKVHRDMFGKHINIPFIKKPVRLQKVYSQDEARKIIHTIKNKKHEAIARLLYTEGMRLGEVVSILVSDCDKLDKSILIRATKNKNDYKKYLDESTLKCLSEYCLWLKERGIKLGRYLFEGDKGLQYSKRSVQQIMNNAILKSGLDKRGSCHVFRRSNATFKLENGWPDKCVADSLNNSIKTVQKHYSIIRPEYLMALPKPAV